MKHPNRRCPGVLRTMRCVSLFLLLPIMAHAGPVYDAATDSALYGNLKQEDVEYVLQIGSVACGPTAAVNSFVYLQKQYPTIYDSRLVPGQAEDKNKDQKVDFYDDMIAAAEVLSKLKYMNTKLAKKTRHDDFIFGKQQYMEDMAPGKTTYGAQDPFPWTYNPTPKYVETKVPEWKFLFDQLKSRKDIELLMEWPTGIRDVGAHWITLTRLHWEDRNSDGVVQQDEDASLDFIDPSTGLLETMDFWHGIADRKTVLFTSYRTDSHITVAVSQGVPEPSSVLLTILGLSVLGFSRRKWRNLC